MKRLCSTGSHAHGKVQHKHNSDWFGAFFKHVSWSLLHRTEQLLHATPSPALEEVLPGYKGMRDKSLRCVGIARFVVALRALWPAPLPPVLTGGCPPLRGGPLSTGGPKVPSSCRWTLRSAPSSSPASRAALPSLPAWGCHGNRFPQCAALLLGVAVEIERAK